jgi:predicted DNA-binding WGR domain protein
MAAVLLKRRCTYIGGGSSKFWEVEVIDNIVLTRWGRIGTEGQVASNVYSSRTYAVDIANIKFKEKLKKGYVAVPINKVASLPEDKRAAEAVALFKQTVYGEPKWEAGRKPTQKRKSKKPVGENSSKESKQSETAKQSPQNRVPQFGKPKRKIKI